MTNPNDIVGTNAGFGGRTSPNAFNDVLGALSQGVVSGWACSPKTGMTIQLGGNGTTRDVAVAEDNAGNRTTINNRTGAPVEITISGAPATGNRIDSIVAYANNPSQGTSTDVDYAPAVGIIAVEGTASGTPVEPSDADIRSAITSDGGTGANAYYVVLAKITVGQGVTTIGSGAIEQGAPASTAYSAQKTADDIRKDLTINSFNSADTITTLTGLTIDDKTLTLAQSATSASFKFYGRITIKNTNNSTKYIPSTQIPGLSYYGLATGLTLSNPPTTAFYVNPAGVRANMSVDYTSGKSTSSCGFGVGTDGQIYICGTSSSSGLSISASSVAMFYYPPCVYFNTNFGDA